MATIRIRLNKNRMHNDGTYPLVFQVIHQRRKRIVYTSVNLKEEEFDANQERAVFIGGERSRHQVYKINAGLKEGIREFREIENRLISGGINYAVEDITQGFRQPETPLSLYRYIHQLILRKKERGKHGNAYKSTLASLQKFSGRHELQITDITPLFLIKYVDYLATQGVSDNTVAYYLRNLRTIYNRAVKERLVYADLKPFTGLSLIPRKTIKRALDIDAMRQLATVDLSETPHLEVARDIFMFSFYMRGASFVDIVFLKNTSISGGFVEYFRHKTGQYIKVAVIPQLAALIEKYKSDSEYLLPIISDDKNSYANYRIGLNRMNRNLKALAKKINIPVGLTSYVARHTWATLAKSQGVPIAVIGEALGHTSERTTRIYLKSFDTSIIDQVNQDVAAVIMHDATHETKRRSRKTG